MKGVKTLCALALLCAFVVLPLRAQQPTGPTQSFGSSMADAVPSEGGPKDYPLGPGDTVELRVLGEAQIDGVYEVDTEGNLTVPFVEHPIAARCRHINEVRKDVITALAKFIRSPQVYMRVREQRSRRAAVVYGAVKVSTQFRMHRRARLLELISNSGGVTEQSSGTIQITHTEASICPEPDELADDKAGAQGVDALGVPFSIYRVADLKLGKPEANPFIRPGDIVYVAEASPIYVTGSVVSPQGLFLREEMTLTTAVAMVGGMRKEAKTSEVHIYRQKPGGGPRDVITADYRAIQKKKAQDIPLQPYDVIEVGEAGFKDNLGANLLKIVTGGTSSFLTNLPVRVLY